MMQTNYFNNFDIRSYHLIEYVYYLMYTPINKPDAPIMIGTLFWTHFQSKIPPKSNSLIVE